MVSADHTDYIFGYYIWLLSHPELRGKVFDSEEEFWNSNISAVNPYIGLDGGYNTLEECEGFTSLGGYITEHFTLWNALINNFQTLEPILSAKFRILMSDLKDLYETYDKSDIRYDSIESRYKYIDSLNIDFLPIVSETEYNSMHDYVEGSEKIIVEIISPIVQLAMQNHKSRKSKHY